MVGTINRNWYENMAHSHRDGEEDTLELFKRVLNFEDVDIDGDLQVWCGNRWLDQVDIDKVIATIEEGI